MKFIHIFPVLLFCAFLPSDAQAVDCWISPQGSGSANGTSATDAYPAEKAQTCWEKTSADGTMHVAPGEYFESQKTFWTLAISSKNDGSHPSGKPSYKKLLGEGKVFLQGSRPVPFQLDSKGLGGRWITINHGAKNISIDNFSISRVEEGVVAKEGGNSHIVLSNLHFTDTRQNMIFWGHPKCLKLSDCRVKDREKSHDIIIKNTSGTRYSKRHVRLAQGVHHVRVLQSHADGGNLDGDFAVGFDVENPSSDIEFSYCSARNNIYTQSEYWNGDGFKTEVETRRIRWDHCSAFDNADAGFDIKTDSAVLENIISLRNSRNVRIWSNQTSQLKNINASYSRHHGGNSTEAGIWTQGKLECHFCTLHNNAIQVQAEDNDSGASVILYDSILSLDPSKPGELISKENNSTIELVRTSLWQKGSAEPDPDYAKKDLEKWAGGKEFNSQRYGKTKGYYEA